MNTKHFLKLLLTFVFCISLFSSKKLLAYADPCNNSCRTSEYCALVCPSGGGGPGLPPCSYNCVGGSTSTCNGCVDCPAGTHPDFTQIVGQDCVRGVKLGTAQRRGPGGCNCYPCMSKNGCESPPDADPQCDAVRQTGACVPDTPPAQPLQGNIWEDLNGDGLFNIKNDVYWSTPTLSCTRANASYRSSTMNVAAFTLQRPSTATWACSAGVPTYSTLAYDFAASRTFVLTPPNGISCAANVSPVVWAYTVCDNAACTKSHTGSGSGCTATITNYSGSFPNYLNWRVNQVIPRQLTGNLYETADTTSCSVGSQLGATGLAVTAFNGATQVGTPYNVGASGGPAGAYNIALTSTDSVGSVCVSGNLSNSTKSYQLSCVKSTGFTCTPGSGACAVNCTPNTIFKTSNATLDFGFSAVSNEKWISTIDGDMYGDSIIESVAPSPLGGFSPYIINTVNGTSVGGHGFAATLIDTQTTGTDVSEKGGSAQRLAILPNYLPNDQWLNKFSFGVPSSADTNVPAGNKFTEGKVYNFTVAQFNQILNAGSYSFDGGNANAPAASIVYVTGAGSISIAKNFTSTNANKTLLVVTTADVNITKDPGTTLASFAVAGASQIDLVIISQKDINFASQYNATTLTFDTPVMLYGSLVASGTINPDRNLGNIGNSGYPATSIRFYPYLMSLIQKYEIANTTSSPYTGLTTVDVQFDYGE